MSLLLHSWGAYRSYQTPSVWRSEDYQVNLMVKVAKGQETNSHQSIRSVDGNVYPVSTSQAANGRLIFAKWAAAKLAEFGIGDALLVPVPSSTHIDFRATFPGRLLTDSIAAQVGSPKVTSAPLLAFTKVMPKASKGEKDSRNQHAIASALKMAPIPNANGRTAVIIDDVVSTGNHMKACAGFLRARGFNVHHGICVGRTVKSEHPTPLKVEAEDLEDLGFFDF